MKLQRCARCVMDTTDPDITFDSAGVCNHCLHYDDQSERHVISGAEGDRLLAAIVARVKNDGKRKPYDCIMGVSGGVDSTYSVYLAKRMGLRPLAVHLDNGWDSELAVKNIERVLRTLEIDLVTVVLDWDEFRDLQVAFLKASTPDSEIPTDHAIISVMFSHAEKHGLKHVLTGFNVRTESHIPRAWSSGHSDWRYIRTVQKRFGSRRLSTYPRTPFVRLLRLRRAQEWTHILNYVDYHKQRAKDVLKSEVGWVDYGGKHYESIYTRFYQGYILPRKFGFDKRKAHFSSLICSGQMTRGDALTELVKPPYPLDQQEADRAYVIKKLHLTESEFQEIMEKPRLRYADYPSMDRFYKGRFYRGMRAIYRVTAKPLLSRMNTG
ncbi:MAG: N-acetyl sugar amidotransferase [Gemmatimonadaceae bacterium]